VAQLPSQQVMGAKVGALPESFMAQESTLFIFCLS